MTDSWPILDLDAIEDRAGEVDPLDDIRALCADVRRKLAALVAAERARDQAEAERDALRKKLAGADEGLNRWCAWQDGLKAVHDEMGLRDEIYRRLIAAGYGPGPTCEHAAQRDAIEIEQAGLITSRNAAEEETRLARAALGAAGVVIEMVTDDRDRARAMAAAVEAENGILRIELLKTEGGDLAVRRADKARAETLEPDPDPWAQVAQLRAAVEAYADGAPTLEVRAGIAAILAAVFPPDGQPAQAECEHIADRGIGEPGRCWTCGAWMVDVVPTGYALTTAELDAAIVSASGRTGVVTVGEQARQDARALFDRMAEAMVQLGARRSAPDPRVVEAMRLGLQRLRDNAPLTPEEIQAGGTAAYVLDAVAELEAGR